MLTFMNQPMSAAAALAVLDIMEKEKLAERARTLGAQVTERMVGLARRYDVIGDVRGPGLFIGVDFVEDQRTKAPATAACKKAWEFAMDNGLITQFGGFASNVLQVQTTADHSGGRFRTHARSVGERWWPSFRRKWISSERQRLCRCLPPSETSVARGWAVR